MAFQAPSKLSTYEFNIRSFHPEKDFGWSGLYFKGDNRGFSLKPSGITGGVTSRIWHRFKLSTVNGRSTKPLTQSDPSKAVWSKMPETYSAEDIKPPSIQYQFPVKRFQNVYQSRIKGKYWGENFAMPLSKEMKEHLGLTYVPSLDVNYLIIVDANPKGHYIDIVTYIKGDAFPNTEAFIVDQAGTALFLGVHVRKGAAPISLALNSDYPMIASAIRVTVNTEGNFIGPIHDVMTQKRDKLQNTPVYSINSWNKKHLQINSNGNRCMGLEQFSKLMECF